MPILTKRDFDTDSLVVYSSKGRHLMLFDGTVQDGRLVREIVDAIRLAESNAYQAAIDECRAQIGNLG